MEVGGKDEAIRGVTGALPDESGIAAFDTVDHWEVDSFAIGIARPDNHRILIYISMGSSSLLYFVSLEFPPTSKDFPFQPAGKFNDMDFANVLKVVKQHLLP